MTVNFPGFSGLATSFNRAAGPLPFPSVALKQIEDCRLPDRADFQAIVFRVMRFEALNQEATKLLDQEAIEPLYREATKALTETVAEFRKVVGRIETLATSIQASPTILDPTQWSVTISRYQSVPLVRKMGLEVGSRTAGDYTTDEVIYPVNVYALPSSIEELGALNLAWRLGNSPWMSYVDPLAELDKISPGITDCAQELPTFSDYLNEARHFQQYFTRRYHLIESWRVSRRGRRLIPSSRNAAQGGIHSC